MEHEKKLCANKICRTCLSESNSLRPLNAKIGDSNNSLIAMLCFITNVNVTILDDSPQQICAECEQLLCQTDNFKRQCLKNEETLSKWFNRRKEISVKQESVSDYIEMKHDFMCPYKCLNCLEKHAKATKTIANLTVLNNINTDQNIKDIVHISKDEIMIPKESSQMAVKDECVDSNIHYNMIDSDFENEDQFLYELKIENSSQNKPKNVLYSCSDCNLDFEYRDKFENHIKETHSSIVKNRKTKINCKKKNELDENNLTCPLCIICNKSYKSVKSLNIHLRRVHKTNKEELNSKTPLKLEKEVTQQNQESYLIQPKIESEVPLQIFECSRCMRKFTKKDSLIFHIKKHEERDKQIVICQICKREFKHQAHLDNHLQSVHNNKEVKIVKDPSETYNSSSRKKHRCKICAKSFQMLSTLKDHIRVHTGEKPYLCSTCGRGFSQKTNLKEHMRRHQGLKPYKCENCDQRFVSKGELVAHNRKHTGAHPFICDICEAGFTTSSSLVKHRRIHTGERPFACDFCPMRFSASGTLKNHVRTHTGEKPHQCRICDKSFVQKNDLVSHTRCHTGERPYVCSTCGQAFRQGSALKTHVKMHTMKEASIQMQRKDNINSVLHTSNALAMLTVVPECRSLPES